MSARDVEDGIRQRLVELIARHAGVAADSIDADLSLWEHFPVASLVEHPSMTSLVEQVHAEFTVFLTEEEWENPTPNELAHRIRVKRENPSLSSADRGREQAEIRKGTRTAFIVWNIVAVTTGALAVDGSWVRRAWVVLGLLALVNGTLLLISRGESRRFGDR